VAALPLDLERKLGIAVERMPAFPKSVQKILELTRNINCLPKDLVSVIEKDPVMTVKILKVINSVYYSLPNKITSVSQSVVYLGINTIKNLALGFAAVGILPRFNAAGFDIQRYLLHSLITASIARQLATQGAKGEIDPGDCYIAGLLHDFGKAVFAQFMAVEFRNAMVYAAEHQVSLHIAEMEVIGTDHAVVGSMLAKRWQFPDYLVECIRDHHDLTVEPTALSDCLRTANQIARKLEIGDSGHPWRDDEPAAAPHRFGPDLDATIASLGDIQRFIDDAQLFAQVSK
jgi:putative nucleotidyltransferase with HDIG domain